VQRVADLVDGLRLGHTQAALVVQRLFLEEAVHLVAEASSAASATRLRSRVEKRLLRAPGSKASTMAWARLRGGGQLGGGLEAGQHQVTVACQASICGVLSMGCCVAASRQAARHGVVTKGPVRGRHDPMLPEPGMPARSPVPSCTAAPTRQFKHSQEFACPDLPTPKPPAAVCGPCTTPWPPPHWPRCKAVPGRSKTAASCRPCTVTAERRLENIRDVPSSVTALQGEMLEVINSGGQDIRMLAGRVPSLNIESSPSAAPSRAFTSAASATPTSTSTPAQPVSLVYDDVVQENPILKGFPIFDMERIEVLRGPQGTLFGRNSPAGVVKFESAKPGKKFEGYGTLSIGRYSMFNPKAR
jgi:hypothetical protein